MKLFKAIRGRVRTAALGVALLLGALTCADPSAHAARIRIATWNLYNLHDEVGVPLRRNAPARSRSDYDVLRKYAARLDADVIALQEINGPGAAALVFPADKYEIFVADVEPGRPSRLPDGIYTGFAVRRGVFDSVTKSDVDSLGVRTTEGRRIRGGVEILVEKNGRQLRLMSVHLKSGCFARSLARPKGDACETLARQQAPLEAWIDERARGDIPFVVIGDFNRAFDVHGARDHLWAEIDDHSPPSLDLLRLPFKTRPACWKGTRRHHDTFIDFFVFDRRAFQMVEKGSFTQVAYDGADRNLERGTPSDHCPLSVELTL